MTVALVTTCKGRVQHLAQTLPKNIKDNPEAKFVVLSYKDGQDLADYIRANHSSEITSGKLAFYEYRGTGPFHMAHAKNMAHRLGILEGGDILVNMDADNFAGPGFAKFVEEQLKDDNVFLWSRMIKEGAGQLARGISGRIAMRRTAFLLIGGYNEIYNTHSPDDKDANARLRRLGLEGREVEPRFLQAIRHNDKMRYREYPHAAQGMSEDFNIQHGPAVVNDGVIGCGTVFKNFSDTPISIAPVPTRIFGIGMHKTATTSLHAAFLALGYKSGHWPSAHWAKAIWREMNETGKSPTLEMCYALCDLPIPLLFRRLDVAYPGSKFILTTRNEDKWLESVRKHWSYELNPFRAAWDTDPFSHRVHQIIYGRTEFHPTVFLERYRKHNAQVLEYFRDRPYDLLIMDMDNGCGWKELCEFLNQPIPATPYPGRNVTPSV
jgi:hypothetical protein